MTLQSWCKSSIDHLNRTRFLSAHYSPTHLAFTKPTQPVCPTPNFTQWLDMKFFPLCSSIIQWHLSLLTTTVAFCSPQWITANIQKRMTLKCLLKYLSAVSFLMHSLHYTLPFSNGLLFLDWKINFINVLLLKQYCSPTFHFLCNFYLYQSCFSDSSPTPCCCVYLFLVLPVWLCVLS